MGQRYYLPCLNGWRAISILMVLLFHGTWFYLSPEGASPNQSLWHYFHSGHYGVSIFFAISGFLITSRILKEVETYGHFNAKEFYIKRFFRIMPPYIFYIGALLIISLFTSLSLTWQEVVSSLAFLRIYLIENDGWYTGHFWSLCVEEHFYILLSLVFIFIKIKRIPLFLFASLIVILGWSSFSFHYKNQYDLAQAIRFTKVLSQMDYMIWGCLYALLDQKLKPLFVKFSSLQWPTILITFFTVFTYIPGKAWILPFLVATSIYFTVVTPQKLTLYLFENWPMAFVGKISYSLYLWQQLFFTRPGVELQQSFGLQNSWFSIIAIFIMAYFSFKFIENPTIAIGRKLIKNKI
ncbi:MAG: acyltransferase [Oligoflexia bacterium]|nr:acyltransferase [Oligoflexia bacterium]